MNRLLERTLIALIAGGAGAGIGLTAAGSEAKSTWGPVLLQHAVASVLAAEAKSLGETERQALQLDIEATLIQVAMLKPKVAALDANALEGLCLLRRAVEVNSVGFSDKQMQSVELARPYLRSVSSEMDAVVSSADPLSLRHGCRAAQQRTQPDGAAFGGPAG